MKLRAVASYSKQRVYNRSHGKCFQQSVSQSWISIQYG